MHFLRLRRRFRYAIGFIGLRKSDVWLSSYPKSGNTWVRFFISNYLSLTYLDGQEITFPILYQMMPELGMSNLLKRWPYSGCPRVIKMHLHYRRLLDRQRSIGVVRDPRDVMVSQYHFLKDRDRPLYTGDFKSFFRDTVEQWFQHTVSWIDHWDLMVRYEELKCSPERQFRRILDFFGVSVDDSTLRESIKRSDIRNVRKSEKMVPPELMKSDSKFRFARDGRVNQWPEYLSDSDLDYFYALQKRYDVKLYK